MKRVDRAVPSPYPYGPEFVNEFSWHGWDPNNANEEFDAQRIHNAYDDFYYMIVAAWEEADSVTEIFKRWFDASHALDVKNVLEKLVSRTIQAPSPLLKTWICEKEDNSDLCARHPQGKAYTFFGRGSFHFCPAGLASPQAKDQSCADLDPFSSKKIISIAFTLLHEVT